MKKSLKTNQSYEKSKKYLLDNHKIKPDWEKDGKAGFIVNVKNSVLEIITK